MERFIPKLKLSKKAKREIEQKQRQTWTISPVSRKSDNKKVYNRKAPRLFKEDYPSRGEFFCV